MEHVGPTCSKLLMLHDFFHPFLLVLSLLIGAGQYLLEGRLPEPLGLYLVALHAAVVLGWRLAVQLGALAAGR